MAYGFELSDVIPATPQAVYDAWMSSAGHTAMTGSPAMVDPHVGGAFEACDGYIVGRTLSLEPGRRIVQSWRTSEFSDGRSGLADRGGAGAGRGGNEDHHSAHRRA